MKIVVENCFHGPGLFWSGYKELLAIIVDCNSVFLFHDFRLQLVH